MRNNREMSRSPEPPTIGEMVAQQVEQNYSFPLPFAPESMIEALDETLGQPACRERGEVRDIAFAQRIRDLVELDRAMIGWAETIFNAQLKGEEIAPPLLAQLQPIFEDVDGLSFYQFLDKFYGALLKIEGVGAEERREIIASARFGRGHLNVDRPDKTIVVLINLTKSNVPKHTGLEALGVETLAGHLYHSFGSAVEVKMFDAQLDSLGDIIAWTKEAAPHILGISVNIGGIPFANEITREIQDAAQKPIVVFGARAAEFYPDNLSCPQGAEGFIVPGWGEIGMEDVVAYQRGIKELKELRNIGRYWPPRNGSWQAADWSAFEQVSLENAAPPRRANLARYQEFEAVTIETRRGCPHAACWFCPRPTSLREMMDYPFAIKLREITYLSALGVNSVPIIDEEFLGGIQGIANKVEFLKRIIEYKKRGWIEPAMNFCVDVRADTICAAEDSGEALPPGAHPLELLKAAGVKFVFVGIEALSQPMLDHLNKGTTVEQNIRAIQILRSKGLKFQAGSLALAPLMEFEWAGETISRARQLNLAELADPSLTMILFSTSTYYQVYFEGARNAPNCSLLDLGEEEDFAALDSLSGIPYRFRDERVGIIAEVHQFHDSEMYTLMKRLRSINAKLIYGGEEDSEIYGEIWRWLGYGRMEIILWGMEELYNALSQNNWQDTIAQTRARVFAEMRRRKQILLRELLSSAQTLYDSLTANQQRLVAPDNLIELLEAEMG